MGIIVKLLGSGLGMASEAIQYVKPQLIHNRTPTSLPHTLKP